MANRFARKTGNWNASDVWSDTPSGTAGAEFIPVAGDVAMANSYTVTINVDATCAEVRNDATDGATASGGFTLASGVTLTANCYSTSAAITGSLITFNDNAPSVAYVMGNISTVRQVGVSNSGTGTLFITGAVFAGTWSASYGIQNASSGVIDIVGNISGAGSSSAGACNNAGGIFNLTGNVAGGTAGNAWGAYNISSGTMTINGNTTGGAAANAFGAYNISSGTMTISGNAIGGTGGTAFGVYNTSSGTITFLSGGIVTSGSAAPGLWNSGSGITTGITAGISVNGYFPFGGRIKFAKPLDNNFYIDTQNTNDETVRIYPSTTLVADSPMPANVRLGTSYQAGGQIGTLNVPPAASVLHGVPVDNTTGTFSLNQSDIDNIIARLAKTATLASVAAQLVASGGAKGAQAFQERRSLYAPPYYYFGSAQSGTQDTDPDWTITRLNFTNGLTLASATGVSWSDCLTTTYV